MARTLVLLPPSEGKSAGGRGLPWRPGTMAVDELDERRGQVLAALGAGAPDATAGTRRAIDRYTGVLYRELDAGSLDAAAKRRLTRSVLVASGLWGLVAPNDRIPDYRLKMGAALPPLGKLSTWWRPAVTEALAPRVEGAVVWDLLPNEHAAAVDWDRLGPRQRVTVRFLDRQGRTVSHWNKLLKGSIVRWLAETGQHDPAALVDLDHPQGYAYDPRASVIDRRRAEVVLRERS